MQNHRFISKCNIINICDLLRDKNVVHTDLQLTPFSLPYKDKY